MKSLSVLTKIDLFLLPLLVLAAFISALDKNAMAYAAVLGMTDDLNLIGQQYSLLGSIFYAGYLLMEFPTVWLLTRLPIGKYASTLMVLWGGCLCLMAAFNSFAGAATVRFCLGVLEAGIMPACIVFTAEWYRREEQPLRTAVWFCPFSGIFGGILAYAIGRIQTEIAVWKLLFLIYGGSTVIVGFVFFLVLPDNHENAWFLSEEECEEAKLRTIENKTGVDMQRGWNSAHVVETLRDPKYWVIAVFGICQAITNAGITNFNPLILSGFGYSKEKTVLLAVPQGIVAAIAQLVASFIALYVPNSRCVLWFLSCIPALVGVTMIRVLDVNQHPIAALTGLYMMGFYNVSWIMAASLISSNTAGATKKSFASVCMAIFYAVGNMIGPQFFLDSQKPHYSLGIGAMVFCFPTMGVCGLLYQMICMHQNKVRDRISARRESSSLRLLDSSESEELPLIESSDEELSDDNDDKTDFENPTFRYVY